MKRVLSCLAVSLLTGVLVFGAAGDARSQIFIDDFESGMPGTQIPANGTPWRVNDSGKPAFYQSANNPFQQGAVYAYLNDDNLTQSIRFMSSNTADTGMLGPQLTDQVTTFSFDFWEPLDTGPVDINGLGFGYSANGQELNAANRLYRAIAQNGQLRGDNIIAGTGSPIAYELQTVHTVFMVTNDSTSPVVDYQPGRTLEPERSDVWISLGGAAPMFAFSLGKLAATTGPDPIGIGFRTFTGDIEEMLIDNVLLVSGATLDRGPFANVPLIPGDVDGDGIGGEFPDDFEPIRANFRKSVVSRSQGDLVKNNVVDFADFREWKAAFLAGGGSLAEIDLSFVGGVPEPGTIVLLLPPLAALSVRRPLRRAGNRRGRC